MPDMNSLDQPLGRLRLGVNIDHVATIRNARGGDVPDPIRAAKIAEAAYGPDHELLCASGGRCVGLCAAHAG